MNLIKTSDKLNKLYDEMMRFVVDNNYDDCDSDCDFFAWFDYSIGPETDKLFSLLNKAYNSKKDVYTITNNDMNVILFVGTESNCIARVKAKFQEMKDNVAANDKANEEYEKNRKIDRAEEIKKEIIKLNKELKKITTKKD